MEFDLEIGIGTPAYQVPRAQASGRLDSPHWKGITLPQAG